MVASCPPPDEARLVLEIAEALASALGLKWGRVEFAVQGGLVDRVQMTRTVDARDDGGTQELVETEG